MSKSITGLANTGSVFVTGSLELNELKVPTIFNKRIEQNKIELYTEDVVLSSKSDYTINYNDGNLGTNPIFNIKKNNVEKLVINDSGTDVKSGELFYNGTALKNVAETITNKSIDGNNNTLTNIPTSALSNVVLMTTNQTIDGVKTFSESIVGDIAGRANQATILTNTRTIAGKNFNGSQNVVLAANDLTDGFLLSRINANETITGVKNFQNPIIGSILGQSNTALALKNSRQIAGVSFNGTSNINIPSTGLSDSSNLVRATGDQNISGDKTFTTNCEFDNALKLTSNQILRNDNAAITLPPQATTLIGNSGTQTIGGNLNITNSMKLVSNNLLRSNNAVISLPPVTSQLISTVGDQVIGGTLSVTNLKCLSNTLLRPDGDVVTLPDRPSTLICDTGNQTINATLSVTNLKCLSNTLKRSNNNTITLPNTTSTLICNTGDQTINGKLTINDDFVVNDKLGIGISTPLETLTVEDGGLAPTFGLRRGTYNDYTVYMKNTSGSFTSVTTTQDTVINVGKGTSSNRSINALGTVNASGSDYAEYMKKSRSDLVIKKGDIVGINNNGELTNVFSESVHFVIKSTNPSYVGGDTWDQGNVETPTYPSILLHVEEYTDLSSQEQEMYSYWEEQNLYANTKELNIFNEENEKYLEDKNLHRNPYDRIAFCGQVPVNIYNAKTGQYVIPKQTDDDKITYDLAISPTFKEYRKSIGKVIKIQEDGRAFVIVNIL